jgi:hypothetical protein
MYKQFRLYLLTLSLLTSLTLYYTDLSGIKETFVSKIRLAYERHEHAKIIKIQQQAIPALPNDEFIKNHHELINGNVFTLPSYLAQSSVDKTNSSLRLEEPHCRGSPSIRAP